MNMTSPCRPRSGPELRSHAVGEDSGEGRLSQTRGPTEQHVVERFAPAPRGLDEDREPLLQFVLADELLEAVGSQSRLEGGLLGTGTGDEETVLPHRRPSRCSADRSIPSTSSP